MTEKKPTMLRLPEDVIQKVKTIAETEHRSMNAQIEYALSLYIAEYEEKHGVIAVTPA